jgi:formylglycine-generating enzyme required for sulfatase activity
VRGSEWKKGGRTKSGDVGSGNSRHPVFRVTPEQAVEFAQVMLHGRLPSVDQWDKAAGASDNHKTYGPYLVEPPTPGKIAIRRQEQGPIEVGAAEEDVSYWKCRDMAGNGEEITRTLVAGEGEIPKKKLKPNDAATLRGKSYFMANPWHY